MSLKSAQQFLEEFANNQEFRTKLANTTSDEQVRVIIENSGYKFSPEEIQTAIEQIPDVEQDELSDEELLEVSGGKMSKRERYKLNQVNQVLTGLGKSPINY